METTLYRKYRPNSFETVFGQEYIKLSIKNSLDMNKLAHAYLFSGPRGVGKTTIARIIAKGVNCSKNGISSNPCLECENCIEITRGYSLDVIEIDAASNRGIEEIRSLKENITYRPVKFRKKVYIIDEVHMLTNEAFNALLKTLEEPPEYVIFILATTEIHKLPDTIISRCVTYNFKTLNEKEVLELINYCVNKENINIDDESIKLIYKKSTGSARDSLSILEQVVASYHNTKITIKETQEALGIIPLDYFINFDKLILNNESENLVKFIDEIYMQGTDIEVFLKDFCDYLKNSKNDIEYIIKTISVILETLNNFKFEDDIRLISYLIIHKLYTKNAKVDNKIINITNNYTNNEFSFENFKNYLIEVNLSSFSKALKEFDFIEIKNHTIYLQHKNNRNITRAFLEDEYNLRRLEEALYDMLKVRHKIYFIDTNIKEKDDGFINKVKSLLEAERI